MSAAAVGSLGASVGCRELRFPSVTCLVLLPGKGMASPDWQPSAMEETQPGSAGYGSGAGHTEGVGAGNMGRALTDSVCCTVH